jgi:hypothetical protein
MSYVKTCW